MKGNEYAITLVIFYITFCTLDLPSNLLLKKFSAKYWLPFLMIGWGSMTLLQCVAYNWAGLIVLRVIMGAFEAGFFAGKPLNSPIEESKLIVFRGHLLSHYFLQKR